MRPSAPRAQGPRGALGERRTVIDHGRDDLLQLQVTADERSRAITVGTDGLLPEVKAVHWFAA